MSDHFDQELCGCTKDMGVCLFVWCVPGGACCVQAKAVDIVKKDGVVVPYLLVCFLSCIGGAINRGVIRDKLKIKGTFIADCFIWWCCGHCAACQEYREVKKKDHH